MLAEWWGPSLTSWVQLLQTLAPRTHLELKMSIYTPLGQLCDEVAEKHTIHDTDLKTTRIGGETLSEPLSVAPSTPSTTFPSTP
jgi:hypothetical protein